MSEIEVKLSEEENKILMDVLNGTISDLSAEVADTDKMDYREKLKSKRNILRKILLKLENKN